MNKKEAWKKFKETGKIEYYLIYKGKEHYEKNHNIYHSYFGAVYVAIRKRACR